MQNAKGLSLALLASVSLLLGCQKQIADNSIDEGTAASRVVQRMTADNCDDCVEEWEDSEEIVFDADDDGLDNTENFTITVSNNASDLVIDFERKEGKTFTKVDYSVDFGDGNVVSGTDNPGSRTSFHLGLTLPDGWEACDAVVVTVTVSGVGGGGGTPTYTGTYYLRELCCNILVGDYFTYSQGFYLSSPTGGSYLDAHPELGDVTIGCATGTEETYTLAEIKALAPGNNTAPGILAKQIITMTLNIKASELGILGTETDLGCLTVVSDGDDLTTLDDTFAGMTVSEILAEANNAYGGCGSSFSNDDLTAILKAIVDNFHEGAVDGGLLTCGSCSE